VAMAIVSEDPLFMSPTNLAPELHAARMANSASPVRGDRQWTSGECGPHHRRDSGDQEQRADNGVQAQAHRAVRHHMTECRAHSLAVV